MVSEKIQLEAYKNIIYNGTLPMKPSAHHLSTLSVPLSI